MTRGKVLVLGDDTRSFLAIVRSLGRQGIKVHVAPANFRSPALRSRYIAAIHDLPPWMEGGAEWLAATQALLRAEAFDLVVACNETTLLPLQRHRSDLAPLARLAIPDDHAIAILFDKVATRELALGAGVPVAAGRLARQDDTAESVLQEFGSPVMVKPRYSYSLANLASRGKAQTVRGAASLGRVLGDGIPGELLLEQFFEGQGMGISLLASNGRVLQAFEHHRVRENGGASFYRVSAPLTTDILKACEAIVAAVPYTGLAMFEFRRNAAAGWILLEVNARPWGSMPLPLALGIDFPYRWYRLLTAGEESPAVPYRLGVYGRNLLPDFRAVRAEAAALGLGPLRRAFFMIRWGMELSRVLTGREVHDVLVRDDPGPGLAEIQSLGAEMWQRVVRAIPGMTAAERALVRKKVARALRQAPDRPRILFVCQGNICRSPFAAALLRSRLAEGAIDVDSAGMMPQPGRKTPDFGLEAAAQFDIDLVQHRSSWLTRGMAESATLLVVFDEINRMSVLDRYPDLRVPLIRLDQLGDPGEILDPIDGDIAEFERCFARIAAGIKELAQLVRAVANSR